MSALEGVCGGRGGFAGGYPFTQGLFLGEFIPVSKGILLRALAGSSSWVGGLVFGALGSMSVLAVFSLALGRLSPGGGAISSWREVSFWWALCSLSAQGRGGAFAWGK